MAKEKTIKKIKEKIDLDEHQKNYLKNYIILIAIFCCCVFLTLYFCKWYEVYQEYEREIPVIRGSLVEINPDDLEHYVADTPSTIIYLCTANDDECRIFEKDFKKLINRKGITDEIVYLNLTGVDNSKFVSEFNEKYKYKMKLNGKYPAFVLFQDGKIASVLQGSKTKKITISKLQNFLELNLIVEEEEEEVDQSNTCVEE